MTDTKLLEFFLLLNKYVLAEALREPKRPPDGANYESLRLLVERKGWIGRSNRDLTRASKRIDINSTCPRLILEYSQKSFQIRFQLVELFNRVLASERNLGHGLYS